VNEPPPSGHPWYAEREPQTGPPRYADQQPQLGQPTYAPYQAGQPGYAPPQLPPGYPLPPPGYAAPGYPVAPPGHVGAPPGFSAAPPGYPSGPRGFPIAHPGYPPPYGYPGYPVAPPVGKPAPARRGPGWWRRNWWALLVVLPLVVLTIGPDLPDLYAKWQGVEPTERIRATSDGWVPFGGGRLRLVSLERARDLKDHTGKPFPLPGSVQIWQATLELDARDGVPLSGCTIVLEDVRGRTFTANPRELINADLDYASCQRPYKVPKTAPFTTVASFLTPGVAPAGVQVTLPSELPRYVWLTAPG
jgi:hypothetical protein